MLVGEQPTCPTTAQGKKVRRALAGLVEFPPAAQNQGSRDYSMTALFQKIALVSVAIALLGCPVAARELTPTEQSTLLSARPGDVLQLGEFLSARPDLPLVPLQIKAAPGPRLLLSDKPEYLLVGDGITLREEVAPGKVRLYLYHVPTPGPDAKTISAVIENLARKPMRLRFTHRARPQPGTDYHFIGKTGLLDYFNSRPEKGTSTIAPHALALLDPQLDAAVAMRDQLVHGFYEFEISQPARITVLQRAVSERSLTVVDTLPLLPQTLPGKATGNGAGRGIFPVSNFTVVNAPGTRLDTAQGPQQLIVADGKSDGWIEGRDSIDGRASRNVGNYGVIYRIRLTRASSDGRALALLMGKINSSSRWCGAQAGAVQVSRGDWPAGTVAIPRDRVFFGKPDEAVLVQTFPPLRKGKTETIEINYSPPGASCIPTPMVFVPLVVPSRG